MAVKKTCLLLLILATGFSQNSFPDEKIEVLAFEYPPIYQNNKDTGLSCEIVTEAFRSAEIETEIRFLPVKRMIEGLSAGNAICAIGGTILFDDPDVKKNVEISETIQYVVQTFLFDTRKHPEGIDYNNLSEMSSYRIGVLNGSGIMRFLEKEPGLNLVKNTIHDGSAKQLYFGRIDIWAIVDLTGMMYLNKLFPEEARYYRFTKPYNLGDVSVVFSKKRDPDNSYSRRFREGLMLIKKSGKYTDIMAKYYGGREKININALTEDMRTLQLESDFSPVP